MIDLLATQTAAGSSMVVGDRSKGSTILWLSDPEDPADFPVEQELRATGLPCLGKAGQSVLQCPACPQSRQHPGSC